VPDAPSKLTIGISIVAVVLTAGGLWITFSDYVRKGNDQRPVLDITDAKVIRRLNVTTTDYVVSGEIDELSITYKNSGNVEASEVVFSDTSIESVGQLFHDAGKPVPLLRQPNMLPGESNTVEASDEAIKGPSYLAPVVYRVRFSYKNRQNGNKYSEPWCLSTSDFEVAKNLPGDGENTVLSIPLRHCPFAN